MIQELQNIKEQLFDAPSDVKEAFNAVVSYFDAEYKVMANRYTGEHKLIRSEEESHYNHPWASVYQGTKDKCKTYIKDHAY